MVVAKAASMAARLVAGKADLSDKHWVCLMAAVMVGWRDKHSVDLLATQSVYMLTYKKAGLSDPDLRLDSTLVAHSD